MSANLIMVLWRVGLTDCGPSDLLARGDETMSKFVTRFLKDESGATAIEYGLIAALIAVAIATILGIVGGKLITTFTSVSTALTPAA
jgi:pilus assembly protein Flp/PilA